MRVAVVHDYLTQRGGAERVVLSMLRAFPEARVLAAVYAPAQTYPELAEYDVECLWLNKVPAFRNDPRLALPLLASAFSGFDLDGVDVVLCSSSGWSHGVHTSAPKIVYCHNPARWLYQADEYLSGISRMKGMVLRGLSPGLRKWDLTAARKADVYLANSSVVAQRVYETYGRRARVLHPASGLGPDGPMTPVPGIEPGFLLTVGRARGYKHTEHVINAMDGLPHERLVVVGHPLDNPPPRVTSLTDVSDARLRWLYAHAAALIAVSHEDFGLTPIEAFGFGTPVIALRAGGYLDTMVPGETGLFIDEVSPIAIVGAVTEVRALTWDPTYIAAYGACFSQAAFVEQLHGVVQEVLDSRTIDLTDAERPRLVPPVVAKGRS